MDLLRFVFVNLLIWTNVLSVNINGKKFQGNFWQTLAPGELLNELDLMTIDELENNRRSFVPTVKDEIEILAEVPLTKRRTAKKPISRKERPNKKQQKYKPVRRTTTTADDSAESTSASVEHGDGYDSTYEQFVNRYFNDAADHYLADNDEDDEFVDASLSKDATTVSGSVEADNVAPLDAQPFETSAKTAKSLKKNCRRVHKNGELCLICKDPHTDAHSETCSYEHSSEPESYAYETQRKFKHNRDSENNDDGEDENVGAENDSSELAAESKLETQTLPPLDAVDESIPNESPTKSTCIKRSAGPSTCLYCRNGLGELKVNCFVSKPLELKKDLKEKPLDENSHKKRRIFKRTLSYVFEKGLDSNGTLLPDELTKSTKEQLK